MDYLDLASNGHKVLKMDYGRVGSEGSQRTKTPECKQLIKIEIQPSP
jgi:hypothetical protein